jgi:hypothetical protein
VADEACPSPVVGVPTWCIFVASTQALAIAVVEAARSAPFPAWWQFFFAASFFHVTLSDSGFVAATAAGVAVVAVTDDPDPEVAGGGLLPPQAASRESIGRQATREEGVNRSCMEEARLSAIPGDGAIT